MTIIGNNAAIAEALDWQLSQLILNPQRRVAWRNLILTPNVGEIYLRPSFMPVRADYAAVGSALRRINGLYQVSVFGPVNVSAVPQDQVADAVVEHFADQIIRRNYLDIRIGSINGIGSGGVPYVSREITSDGSRMVPVTIPWWCDSF